jgi:hypothetical protein
MQKNGAKSNQNGKPLPESILIKRGTGMYTNIIYTGYDKRCFERIYGSNP